jgi:cytochrome bd-type quinol oxidase subunit 1
MAAQTRRGLLIGALLAFALSAYSLMTGRPGDFGGAAIGLAIGATFGVIAVLPELIARRRSRRDEH